MKHKSGQTLVMLLIFVIIVTTITTATVAVTMINSAGASKFEQGFETQQMAESGVENAVLRLLRDPNYRGSAYIPPTGTQPEGDLTINNGTVQTSISGSGTDADPLIIISTATNGNFVRQTKATATYTDNVLELQTWKDLF